MSQQSNHYPLETWEANGIEEPTAADWQEWAEWSARVDLTAPDPEPEDLQAA